HSVLSSSRTRRPPTSTLFPYTTLFRSKASPPCRRNSKNSSLHRAGCRDSKRSKILRSWLRRCSWMVGQSRHPSASTYGSTWRLRSEEHTSELQSRENLVCRLLLEKKNA